MAKQPEIEELPTPPSSEAPTSTRASLLPLILVVILVPLLTVGLWEFYMLPSLGRLIAVNTGTSEESETAEKAGTSASKAAEPIRGEAVLTYELKDIVANLSGSLKSRYIKVSFTLESRAQNFPQVMEENRAKLIDATLSVLSDLTLQDLEEPGVKNIVRNDLINAFGQTLRSNVVEQLYFSEFVVQ